jgi:hypothetical protein
MARPSRAAAAIRAAEVVRRALSADALPLYSSSRRRPGPRDRRAPPVFPWAPACAGVTNEIQGHGSLPHRHPGPDPGPPSERSSAFDKVPARWPG